MPDRAPDISLLRDFADVLEAVRSELDESVEREARSLPTFARLMERIPEQEREAQQAESRRIERAALHEGKWREYVENLRGQGALYAQMGVRFRDWYRLLRPYRDVILRAVLPEELTRARSVVRGMDAFLDVAMSVIAEAYIAAKEDLVRQTEAQLSLYIDMFRNAPVGMLVYEWARPPDPASFTLVAANPQAATLSAVTTMDNVGQAVGESAPQLVERGVVDHYVDALDSGEPQAWTARVPEDAPPGRRRVFDCHCYPLGPRHVGLIFEDVTPRERMQAELRRHVEDLERSNRELDEFAYVASHDLKAPLRDVHNLAKWIDEDVGDSLPEDSRRHLTLLGDRVVRMERLLDDLLEYSRAGRMFQGPEDIDVRNAVDEAVALASVPDGFVVEVTGDSPTVRGPKAPLGQIVRNLVGNAVKHHHRDAGRVTVAIALRGEWLDIAVSDDGPGIAPEFHERVFGMFTTLRPRDELEGSGMGLALVKKLVEAHGGAVELDSAPGRGTTVRFTWPRHFDPGAE